MNRLTLLLAIAALNSQPAWAQSPAPAYMSEVRFFGSNFCPDGFAPMRGVLLLKADFPELHGLLGTRYGGDAERFALPALPPVYTADRRTLHACMAMEGPVPPRE